uniref:V-type proton ATPase subunit a n=1 Tax=Meloidogyne hapla TaxID=6305 RepID=A0A1I8BEA6_MELHA
MSQTREHRMKVLNAVAANHRSWLKQVRIHKSIYSTLNNFTFDGIGKFFVAECWVPLDDVQAVREALETGVFGDLGHGILMFLCGLYLVVRERNLEARQIKDEVKH